MQKSNPRRNGLAKRLFGTAFFSVAIVAGTVAAHAEVVCRANPPIETLRQNFEPCGNWCPGDAGRQHFRCGVNRGAMMMFRTGYLVRSAAGTHYIISDNNGARLTPDYREACEALLAYCQ